MFSAGQMYCTVLYFTVSGETVERPTRITCEMKKVGQSKSFTYVKVQVELYIDQIRL